MKTHETYCADVVILMATPGGLAAAVAAARLGANVVILERSAHLGGLPANGLGATDLSTRSATGGFFADFVARNLAHYVQTYGADSEQVKICSGGFHFEPSVAEQNFLALLAQYPNITVKLHRQFDALPANIVMAGPRIGSITVTSRTDGTREIYTAQTFIDASYEGDLSAAARVPFRCDRESFAEFREPAAGVIYAGWPYELGAGTTHAGDNLLQAYNYRLCLTDDPARRMPIAQPAQYQRSEYISLVDDVQQQRWTGVPRSELWQEGIGRIVNCVRLPNAKTDANNQHLAFISTDLPEENYPWPTADWAWRDAFAQRLQNYILGLLWFAQNDPALPEDFRLRCQAFGLAADEYQDNGHFPRQVYVREGRRMQGRHLFTAHDALPIAPGLRPPIHADSITASHYALDSHATRKREANRVHLEGFFSYKTQPYMVPLGVMQPREVENLLFPVPASATHIGFSTLRMEPCWMALGEAAGVVAGLARQQNTPATSIKAPAVQAELLRHGAVLAWFEDVPVTDPDFPALQRCALRGLFPSFKAELDTPVGESLAGLWGRILGTPINPRTLRRTLVGEIGQEAK
ncbi:MAG: FAD-dependent oxidoreductase [Phycisphaerae bacterium]